MGRTTVAMALASSLAAERAEHVSAQGRDRSRPRQVAPQHDDGVVREVRVAQHGRRARLGRGLDPGESELPAAGRAGQEPHGGTQLDEPVDVRAEPSSQEPSKLDLVATGEHDLSAAHDARVQGRVAKAERDDEAHAWAGRRGARRCRRLRRLRRKRRRHDGTDGDHEERTPISHAAQPASPHASPRRTSTGVPVVAKAYINGASRAIIRTQPCEAGYAGTYPYSWKAIPPVK